MPKSTDEKLDELLNILTKNPPRPSSGSSDTSATQKAFDMSIEGIKKSVSGAAGVFDSVKKNVQESADMYQSLSKAGMNFSGDLFAMSNAAVGMRMSTKEMEESFLSFTKDGILKGFGTNLTSSAEGFAKASKHFFDNMSQETDKLRAMGFTVKDINEVLALQGVTLRGKFKSDQEMAEIAANNAEKLATEMDALSKLTGKSRAEQAEMLKKQQADMQFEAAIRMKTAGMSAEEAAKFEANARQQLHEAQVLGQGQMFKEIFATGQIMSKEAATQAAINRDQAVATEKMAKTAADRTLEAGEREKRGNEARLELMAAATKDLNDKNKQMAASLGDAGGAYSKIIMDQYGKQIDLSRAIEKVAAANNIDLNTKEGYNKAAKMAMEEIKDAQSGLKTDSQGRKTEVDASSKALAAFQGRLGDAASVINEKFTQPIQKDVNQALNKLAEELRATGDVAGAFKRKDMGPESTAYQRMKATADAGEQKGVKGASGFFENVFAINQEARETVEKTVPAIIDKAKEGWKTVQDAAKAKTPRSAGSYAMTGNLFENFGQGKTMELHGIESVMTPKDLDLIVKNTVEGAMKAIPKTGMVDTAEMEEFSKVAKARLKELTDLGEWNNSPSMSKLDEMKKSVISAGSTISSPSMSKLDEMKKSVISAGSPKTGNLDLNTVKETVNASISSSYSDKVDKKSLKFDQFGMPITGQIKARAQEIPAELQKKEEAKKAETKTDVESMKKGIAAGKPAAPEPAKPEEKKPVATTGKESTLNDVVQALNQLNSKVSSLIEVQKDIGQKQIKATKANSKDVYAS